MKTGEKMVGNTAEMRKALLQTYEWLKRLFEGGNDDFAVVMVAAALPKGTLK